jgi:hypothetical protein
MRSEDVVVPYVKDAAFERVLDDMNNVLEPLEANYVAQFTEPRHPTIFIAGTQRSGTTLLMQLLIARFEVGYVSNLIARFWKAPYIGARLFKELQRKRHPREPTFRSRLGTTYGYEGPHEFGYFWQHWFPYSDTHQVLPEDLAKIDFDRFCRDLAALESVFDAVMVFKNPIVFSLNITPLAEILPNALFLICRRDPLYVAQSTLQSRIEYYDDKGAWLSVKPKQYTWLKDEPYPKQIAGQIYFTEKQIQASLDLLEPSRYLTVEYENLCKNPGMELERVASLVSASGGKLKSTAFRPDPFTCTNHQSVDDDEFSRLKDALQSFYGDKFDKEEGL